MARSTQTVNTVVRGSFAVYDTVTNAPILGLVDGNFTKLVAKNHADDATVIAIVEIGSGRYGYTITPGSVAYWHVLIRHASYNLRGWQDEFDVVAA
jgi:hypothetical protein